MPPLPAPIAEVLLRLLRERGPGKTACPSEVARALDPIGWRGRLADVRATVLQLESAGELVVMQRGSVVRASSARGPVRIALPDEARRVLRSGARRR
jgi:uncharacterized protein DUF3253